MEKQTLSVITQVQKNGKGKDYLKKLYHYVKIEMPY
jgi:hypothetical protein